MRKAINKKIILLILASVFLALSVFGGISLFRKASVSVTAEQSAEISELQEKYKVGETITVPSMKLSHGGKEYDATYCVFCPNGEVKKANDYLRLTQAGVYSVQYTAVADDGTVLMENKSFTVVEPYVESNGLRSTAVYGVDTSAYQTGNTGLTLKLYNGETFTFNEAIDLNEVDCTEAISFFVIPSKKVERNEKGKPLNDDGTVLTDYTKVIRDARNITFKFTDLYDSTNCMYVKVYTVETYRGAWECSVTSLAAGTSSNCMVGYDRSNGRTVIYKNMALNYYHFQQHSFGGVGNDEVGKQFVKFGFDLKNKIVNGADSELAANRAIADFTNTFVFGEEWKGFTTGKVRLSVWASGYTGSDITLMFDKVGGLDLSKTEYSGGSVTDISVDYENETYAEKAPIAIVNKAYPIPKAVALSFGKDVQNVQPKVYFNYGYNTQYRLNVQNGTFIPDRTGTYTIEYTVKDNYGVAVVKTLTVEAVQSAPLTATLPTDYTKTGVAGKEIVLAEPIVSGGSGVAKVETKVQSAVVTGSFLPEAEGTYTVEYVVCDYVGQTVNLSYTVTVGKNPVPIIEEGLAPNEVVLEGGSYEFSAFKAHDYSSGQRVEIPTKITVVDANGENEVNGLYVAKGKDGQITVRYTAESASGQTAMKEYVVSVSNAGDIDDLDPTAFFYSKDMTTGYYESETVNGVELIADGSKEEVSADFINKLVADNFRVTFACNPERNQAKGIVIKLTDSVNADISATIVIQKDPASGDPRLRPYINGKPMMKDLTIRFENNQLCSFFYAYGTLSFDSYSVQLVKDDNGNDFNGFPSGYVNLSVGLIGVNGEASVIITRLQNNQAFLKDYGVFTDFVAPAISVNGSYDYKYEKGSTVEVLDVFVADVISSYVTATVTVTSPSGTVSDENGNPIKASEIAGQKFVLEEYGTYIVKYEAMDDSGNRAKMEVRIKSLNLQAGEITVGTIPSSAKVGDTITLPEATAVDSLGQVLPVSIYVNLPNMNMVCLQGIEGSGKAVKFKFERAGTYQFIYMTEDEDGNISTKMFAVEVEE